MNPKPTHFISFQTTGIKSGTQVQGTWIKACACKEIRERIPDIDMKNLRKSDRHTIASICEKLSSQGRFNGVSVLINTSILPEYSHIT